MSQSQPQPQPWPWPWPGPWTSEITKIAVTVLQPQTTLFLTPFNIHHCSTLTHAMKTLRLWEPTIHVDHTCRPTYYLISWPDDCVHARTDLYPPLAPYPPLLHPLPPVGSFQLARLTEILSCPSSFRLQLFRSRAEAKGRNAAALNGRPYPLYGFVVCPMVCQCIIIIMRMRIRVAPPPPGPPQLYYYSSELSSRAIQLMYCTSRSVAHPGALSLPICPASLASLLAGQQYLMQVMQSLLDDVVILYNPVALPLPQ